MNRTFTLHVEPLEGRDVPSYNPLIDLSPVTLTGSSDFFPTAVTMAHRPDLEPERLATAMYFRANKPDGLQVVETFGFVHPSLTFATRLGVSKSASGLIPVVRDFPPEPFVLTPADATHYDPASPAPIPQGSIWTSVTGDIKPGGNNLFYFLDGHGTNSNPDGIVQLKQDWLMGAAQAFLLGAREGPAVTTSYTTLQSYWVSSTANAPFDAAVRSQSYDAGEKFQAGLLNTSEFGVMKKMGEFLLTKEFKVTGVSAREGRVTQIVYEEYAIKNGPLVKILETTPNPFARLTPDALAGLRVTLDEVGGAFGEFREKIFTHVWPPVVAPVPGPVPRDGSVKLVDGGTGAVAIPAFRPLDAGGVRYTGIVNTARGDINGDGKADLLVAAASPVGQDGLDATKAGKVFAFDGAALAAGTTPEPFRTFTPFTSTFSQQSQTGATPASTAYTNGLNVAVADVNGDGTNDVIAGSRGGSASAGLREYGRFAVVSGKDGTPIGAAVSPFGTAYEKGVVVVGGDFDGDGKAEVAVTRGGPVAASNPNKAVRLKGYRLNAGQFADFNLGAAAPGSAAFAPFAGLTGTASGIERDARLAAVDVDGNGKQELVFAALDPFTSAGNTQVRAVVYGVDVATGVLTTLSKAADGSAGGYLLGTKVVEFAILGADRDADKKSELAVAVEDGTPSTEFFLPLTGAKVGTFALDVATGGIALAGL